MPQHALSRRESRSISLKEDSLNLYRYLEIQYDGLQSHTNSLQKEKDLGKHFPLFGPIKG